jgi:hypothetical protein
MRKGIVKASLDGRYYVFQRILDNCIQGQTDSCNGMAFQVLSRTWLWKVVWEVKGNQTFRRVLTNNRFAG